jgi:histidinol-phosphate aminotransferase
MRDHFYKNECAKRVKASWAQLASGAKLGVDLKQLGFRLWDFQADFLLVKPPKVNAEQIYLALKQWGILVRYFKQPGLEDKLCMTVGTDERSSGAG